MKIVKINWNKREVQKYGLIVAVLGISAGISGTIFVQKIGLPMPEPNFVFNVLFCSVAFFSGMCFGAFITAGMIEILKKKGIIK